MAELDIFWRSCLDSIRAEVTNTQFGTWVSPLMVQSMEGNVLTIIAPNTFKLEWAKKNYTHRLEELARRFWQKDALQVVFILQDAPSETSVSVRNNQDQAQADTNASTNTSTDTPSSASANSATDAPVNKITNGSAPQRHSGVPLAPQFTFAQFVVGKANQLAVAAAQHVANAPESTYTPLVIYGSPGLGKTHLLHAIGHHIAEHQPECRIHIVSGEDYVREVVTAYQRKNFDAFKQSYHKLDVLLVDDIQFIAGKARTQDEFFFAYEALKNSGKRIILAADSFPSAIEGMDRRLISRFSSGLTVTIEPPELDMRVAILMKKAATQKIQLTDEIAFFIAKHLRANVRELEGALNNLKVYTTFNAKPVSLEMVRSILKDRLSYTETNLSVDDIQKEVALFYRIKVSDLSAKTRLASIVRPRQVAMYFAKELTQLSLPDIGRAFNRDHTTVLHAVRKITADRNLDQKFDGELHALEQSLHNR